jgi:hypothetical protein
MERSVCGTPLENASTRSLVNRKDIQNGFHAFVSLLVPQYLLSSVVDGIDLLRYGI